MTAFMIIAFAGLCLLNRVSAAVLATFGVVTVASAE